MADVTDNQEDRTTVRGEDEEIFPNEKDVDSCVDTKLAEDESKPSNQQFSSQSRGTSAQSNTQDKEGKKEVGTSSEGIFSTEWLYYSKSYQCIPFRLIVFFVHSDSLLNLRTL